MRFLECWNAAKQPDSVSEIERMQKIFKLALVHRKYAGFSFKYLALQATLADDDRHRFRHRCQLIAMWNTRYPSYQVSDDLLDMQAPSDSPYIRPQRGSVFEAGQKTLEALLSQGDEEPQMSVLAILERALSKDVSVIRLRKR